MKNPLLKKQAATIIAVGLGLAALGCQQQNTPRPDFSVMSSPQLPALAHIAPTPMLPTPTLEPPTEAAPASGDPSLFEMLPVTVLPDAPTPTATLVPTATATITPTDTPALTATASLTPTASPLPAGPPDEPRRGGSWDMEDGFEVWLNPYGDDCSGSKVAAGWNGFTSRGQYGSSCFYLNDYGPNVFSGQFSQLITFDFVDSHAGLSRTFDSRPGHTYQVTAHLRHVNTVPPMQFHFGVDLTGGSDWQADSVQWTPWKQFQIDQWITHEQTFTAAGPKTTIFIKGFHDTASQGGATYVDTVEIIDLG